MPNVFKFLSVLLLFGSLISKDGHATYVFYRGYHFLSDADPINDLTPRGIRSWSVAPDLTEDKAQEYADKIKSLARPWTREERRVFESGCFSPLAHLVQHYTNSYKTFTSELKNPASPTRRILRLAGLEIDSNPFLSTSLKAEQAARYGSGLKLYGNEELRRYPGYNAAGVPANETIGYLDIIAVEDKDIGNTGAFFVVESFARGDTRLSYHWSKKLTEEQEVIFPFIIPSKYHQKRLPIKSPHLIGVISGLRVSHWKNKINKPGITEDDRKGVELKLLQRTSQISAQVVEDKVEKALKSVGKSRSYRSPEFIYTQRRLIPDDAAAMREAIESKVVLLGKRYSKFGDFGSIDITSYLQNPVDRYVNAYSLRKFGLTVPVSFDASIALDGEFSYEALAILAETPGLTGLSLTGPDMGGIYPEEYDEDMDYADRLIPLANLHNTDPWRHTAHGFKLVIKALERRNRKGYGWVSVDVTGQSLSPGDWDELSAVVELEDENREGDEDAIEQARVSVEGYFGDEDWRDEDSDYYESPPEDNV